MEAEALSALLPAETSGPEETVDLGRHMAGVLKSGSIVAVYGQLGAGKTQLIKGVCAGLGYPIERVHSPTFTIVNEYDTASGPVYHFDAYRVEKMEDFFDLGYEDYFFSDGICLVEWADRVESLVPGDALRVLLRHAGASRRRIELASDAR